MQNHPHPIQAGRHSRRVHAPVGSVDYVKLDTNDELQLPAVIIHPRRETVAPSEEREGVGTKTVTDPSQTSAYREKTPKRIKWTGSIDGDRQRE